MNNLAKRIKRVAFGLTNFRHHRVRCLLYAGRPDWTLVPTIQPLKRGEPENASVVLASNLPFSEWGTVIPDPRLVAAIVDRVTIAHIIETGTDSFRLGATKSRARRKPA